MWSYNRKLLAIHCSSVLLALLMASSVHARGVVGGRYLQNSGRQIVLEVSIGAPAPASLILKQQLPPGTRIVGAAPPVKKYTPANGMATWLITGLKPGRLIIRLQLESPLQGAPPMAEVRCKDPVTGAYMTTRIQ